MWLVFLYTACVGIDPLDDTAGTDASSEIGVIPGPSGPSRIESDCAPDDGPAVRLVVGLEEGTCESAFDSVPHMRIHLWEDADFPIELGTYAFGSGSGSAWYASSPAGVEQYGTSGEVVVDSSSDGVVAGNYRVVLDSGVIVGGPFSAEACGDSATCG